MYRIAQETNSLCYGAQETNSMMLTENFLKRHQHWMLAVLSAILLLLSFPNANLFPLAWVALVPFFIAFRRASNGRSAFWIGYLTGFLFFGGLLPAIALLYPYANIFATLVGYLLLVGYTALYFAVFPVLMRIVPWRSGPLFLIAAAALWTALEWVRSWMLTGFPWGSIGYSQWNNPLGIQIASLVGVHGISFIIVLFNASVASLICNRHRWRQETFTLVLPLLLIFFSFGYGALQLRNAAPIDSGSDTPVVSGSPGTLNIALVPGNVSQLEKWDVRQFPQILQRYINLTHTAGEAHPDLIVWPETAIRSEALTGEWPTYYRRFSLMLNDIATPILIGTANEGDIDETIGEFSKQTEERSSDVEIYNRVLSISPEGKITGGYAKRHLVPFGEYVPLSDLLPPFIPNFIQFRPFAFGKSVNLLPVFNVKNSAKLGRRIEVGASICFESVFPDEFRRPVQKGAQVMGIFTNDAWFKGTAFPELHLSMAPFRAVENRIAVFRCANGGFTCVVDRFGRITTPLVTPDTTQQVLMASVPLLSSSERKQTLYTRYGDWFPILCAILCVGGFGSQIVLRHRRRNS